MTLKNLVEQLQYISNKVVEAESCGNTFLIYELLPHEDLDFVKDEVIYLLRKRKRDSGLVLQGVEPNIWQMFVVEKDGSVSAFCGNGAKSIALYMFQYHKLDEFYLMKDQMEHCLVRYQSDCNFPSVEIKNVELINGIYYVFGEPHIIYATSLMRIKELANTYDNVNFSCIEQMDRTRWKIITWERGVNGVTQSCGSACVAAMCFLVSNGEKATEITFECPGGDNIVSYRNGLYVLTGQASCDPRI